MMMNKKWIMLMLLVAFTASTIAEPDRVHGDRDILITLNVNRNTTSTVNNGTYVNNNTGWSTLTSTVYNDTAGVGVCIGCSSPLQKLDVRGNLNLSGFANTTGVYLREIISCTQALETDSLGRVVCGTDATGASGGNSTAQTDAVNSIAVGGGVRSWGNITFVNSSTINWTSGETLNNLVISAHYRNESLSNLDNRERQNNISQTNALNALSTNLSLLNASATALDARQAADNASVARTNVGNTFTGDQFIIGNLNVSGFINTSRLLGANITNNTFSFNRVSCTGTNKLVNVTQDVYGLWTADCGADSTGAGGGVDTVNGLAGSVLIEGSALVNVTNGSTIKITLNHSVARINFPNIFSTIQYFTSINVSDLANITNLSVNGAILTLPSRSILSDYINSLDQAKLSITLPIANTTGPFPQNRMSIENLPTSNTTGPYDQSRMSITLPWANLTSVNSGWKTSALLVYNDTSGINVTIGTQNNEPFAKVNIYGGGLNVSGLVNATQYWLGRSTDIGANLSALNISATAAEKRESADNATQEFLINNRFSVMSFHIGSTNLANMTNYYPPDTDSVGWLGNASGTIGEMQVMYNITICAIEYKFAIAGQRSNNTANMSIQTINNNVQTNFSVLANITYSNIANTFSNRTMGCTTTGGGINVTAYDNLTMPLYTPTWDTAKNPTIVLANVIRLWYRMRI